MKSFKAAWKIIFFVSFLLLPAFCSNAAETDETAIREAVEQYYEILSGKNLDELVEYDAITRERILQILALKELGMQGYQNIELPYTIQLSTDTTVWVVHASYELIIDNLPPLPGAEGLLVKKENGHFRFLCAYDYMDELPDVVVDELNRKATRPEIAKWYSHMDAQYYELAKEHPEISDFVALYQTEAANKLLEYRDWLLNDNMDFPIDEYCANSEKQGLSDDKDNDSSLADNTYTVQAGDCLWKIAGSHCGSEERWVELYEQNKNVIGDNPSLIYPGQTLSLGLED
ncbi:MAG: LysM peptidoglycan-binding domain-containing protein [Lachnoclostridium sp.]|nr:LysM peptidoglycan-binding domain-containing protein [Lachnospira sp.]MCM1247385.1 LysM peptidoglycan-binding domain-containing protein [Lachnoclostridium sp.]MCM1535522.1 LysM peptidoglycan-binding domain-containing protein [Clostridium sp.]